MTTLTPERLAEIRYNYDNWGDENLALAVEHLLAHIGALAAEAKLAEAKLAEAVSAAEIDERSLIIGYLSERAARVGGSEAGLIAELCDQIRAITKGAQS